MSIWTHYSFFFSCAPAAADGEEAGRGAPSADAVWDHRGDVAGEPHPEGVPQSVLPGTAGHTLPGRRAGEQAALCRITALKTKTLVASSIYRARILPLVPELTA